MVIFDFYVMLLRVLLWKEQRGNVILDREKFANLQKKKHCYKINIGEWTVREYCDTVNISDTVLLDTSLGTLPKEMFDKP